MGRSLISSMLLRPIIFTFWRSMAPYRELVFTIGSPIVFQTTPPQPASKARMACPPVLVGGPEASQKGLGLVIPEKLPFRSSAFTSAIDDLSLLARRSEPCVQPARGCHSLGNRVHDFA